MFAHLTSGWRALSGIILLVSGAAILHRHRASTLPKPMLSAPSTSRRNCRKRTPTTTWQETLAARWRRSFRAAALWRCQAKSVHYIDLPEQPSTLTPRHVGSLYTSRTAARSAPGWGDLQGRWAPRLVDMPRGDQPVCALAALADAAVLTAVAGGKLTELFMSRAAVWRNIPIPLNLVCAPHVAEVETHHRL